MPNYTYKCAVDGYVTVFQKLSDPPLQTCPACEELPVRRAIVPSGMPQTRTYCPAIDCEYYRSLASKPNDPEARVSGPHSLARLIDKRRRQGWTVHTKGEPDVVEDPGAKKKAEAKARRKEWLKREFGLERS